MWTTQNNKQNCAVKTQPKSKLLLTIGLAIALLAGCGAPAAKPAEGNAETWEILRRTERSSE